MRESIPRKRRMSPQTSISEATEDSKRVRNPRRCLMDALVTRHLLLPDEQAAVRFQNAQILLNFRRARHCLFSIPGEPALFSVRPQDN